MPFPSLFCTHSHHFLAISLIVVGPVPVVFAARGIQVRLAAAPPLPLVLKLRVCVRRKRGGGGETNSVIHPNRGPTDGSNLAIPPFAMHAPYQHSRSSPPSASCRPCTPWCGSGRPGRGSRPARNTACSSDRAAPWGRRGLGRLLRRLLTPAGVVEGMASRLPWAAVRPLRRAGRRRRRRCGRLLVWGWATAGGGSLGCGCEC